MASGINKVMILGHVGKDPEVRFTPSGQAVCNFSLAAGESWTDKQGQKQERTEWFRIVAWGKTGELCGQYLKKGRQAFVEGKLQTREYEDNVGVKRYSTEVVAQSVQFLGGKEGGQAPQAHAGLSGGRPQKDDMGYDAPAEPGADDIPW